MVICFLANRKFAKNFMKTHKAKKHKEKLHFSANLRNEIVSHRNFIAKFVLIDFYDDNNCFLQNC